MGILDRLFARDLDALTLKAMKKAGADLSLPHKIDFYLQFKTQEAANQSVVQVENLGLTVAGVHKLGDEWEIHAQKEMVPDLKAIKEIKEKLANIARLHAGELDGWGTAVTPRQRT
jgi:hypothetical protein